MTTPALRDDEAWMQQALQRAARAEGRTAPLPLSGALVVDEARQQILGAGWRAGPDQPPAETVALHTSASGATLYVSLEPQDQGLDAILASGLSRVVVGMLSPEPGLQGRGVERLRAAGIAVTVGVAEEAARRLNAAYLTAILRGRPLLVLKAAASLDGRIADAFGQSQWITGAAARQAGHALRDRLDAVLIGSGTLLADDPALTTRLASGAGRDALPIVLDSRLRCPAQARILTAGRRPLFFCAPDAPPRPDLRALAEVIAVPRDRGQPEVLDWSAILAHLPPRGIHSVLVEGGGRIHHSLLQRGLADRVELFFAPKVLAGGPGWVDGAPFSLSAAPQLQVTALRSIGEDIQISLEPQDPPWKSGV